MKIVIEAVQSKQTSLFGESIVEPAAHPVEVNPTLIVPALALAALVVKIVPPFKILTLESKRHAFLNKAYPVLQVAQTPELLVAQPVEATQVVPV